MPNDVQTKEHSEMLLEQMIGHLRARPLDQEYLSKHKHLPTQAQDSTLQIFSTIQVNMSENFSPEADLCQIQDLHVIIMDVTTR